MTDSHQTSDRRQWSMTKKFVAFWIAFICFGAVLDVVVALTEKVFS